MSLAKVGKRDYVMAERVLQVEDCDGGSRIYFVGTPPDECLTTDWDPKRVARSINQALGAEAAFSEEVSACMCACGYRLGRAPGGWKCEISWCEYNRPEAKGDDDG